MNRIPPSERILKKIDALLEGDWVNGEELASKLILLGAQHLGQEILEQEVTDYPGWGRNKRREESNEHSGYRPARVDTAEGRGQLQVPQAGESAEPYRSRLVDFLRGNSDVLERLVLEMYTRGFSTRDVEEAFREVTGDLLLSRTAASALTDQLWADYQTLSERDLSNFEVECLFLDGSMSHCDTWLGSRKVYNKSHDPRYCFYSKFKTWPGCLPILHPPYESTVIISELLIWKSYNPFAQFHSQ